MKLIIILASIILTSCGGLKEIIDLQTSAIVDKEFRGAVDRFNQEAQSRNISVVRKGYTIKWDTKGEVPETVAAMAWASKIRVREAYKERDQNTLDLIILHEMGHMVLKQLEHRGNGDSIMSAGNFSKELKSDPWKKKYLDELFSQHPSNLQKK